MRRANQYQRPAVLSLAELNFCNCYYNARVDQGEPLSGLAHSLLFHSQWPIFLP